MSPYRRAEADEARKKLAVGKSDHLTMLNAFDRYMDALAAGGRQADQFCQEVGSLLCLRPALTRHCVHSTSFLTRPCARPCP